MFHKQLKENGMTRIKDLTSTCQKVGIAVRTCQRAYLAMEKEGTIKRSKEGYKPAFSLTDGWDGDK